MKYIASILVFIFLPVLCMATVLRDSNIEFKHDILSLINYILVIVSIISIRQFFWPREKNNTMYQIFNMVFTVVFYILSLQFIISHKNYFVGFEGLSDVSCVTKFFFDFNFSMVLQVIVLFSFVINILYILRYGKRFYLDIV
jgi:hypothetical protein